MDEIVVDEIETPSLSNPVLIEGLPGVANVGALAAGHLVDEFESTLVRQLYSEHFPPQVLVEDSEVSLTGIEIHAIDLQGQAALLVTGDHQPQTPAGHYRITTRLLDIAQSFDVNRVIAMGGVPTGELIDTYEVLGVATDETLGEQLEEAGVVFRGDEPAGGIVGVSGLLLGLGGRRGFESACLMGETSGYLVDPKSATQLLAVLQSLLDFEVDTETLDERAAEMEEVLSKIQEFDAQTQMEVPSDEDLRYIG